MKTAPLPRLRPLASLDRQGAGVIRQRRSRDWASLGLLVLLVLCTGSAAEPVLPPVSSPSLPDMGSSLVRLLGSLAFVLALFFAGVWVYRNWQRVVLRKGRAPKLQVLETRSLGGRHALYVVAYEEQRLLLSASPGGVALLSHLPTAEKLPETADPAPVPAASFLQTLQRMLARR